MRRRVTAVVITCVLLIMCGCTNKDKPSKIVTYFDGVDKAVVSEEQNEQKEQEEQKDQENQEEQKVQESKQQSKNQDQEQQSQETDSTMESSNESGNITYYDYVGEVPHIFMHALIAYPELKDKSGLMRYDNDCITVKEFKRLLEQLYQNGYSLVDINKTFYQDENGNMKLADSISVPEGRKPIVFSVDDVVYDVKKRGNGMVDLLALDKDNNIVAGTYKRDGTIEYSSDNEFVPILEEFVKKHPDFSSHGAKFTLCMTGFTGVFGYRTDRNYEGDRDAEIEKATAVANRLKELGYTFASHSYGHYDVTKLTFKALVKDLEHFRDEVEPIIGDVSVFVYPYGKLIKPEEKKYRLLLDYGYKVFCSVSNFFYERDYEDGKSIYMTRVAIDGYSLRHYKSVLAPVIDVTKVIDR